METLEQMKERLAKLLAIDGEEETKDELARIADEILEVYTKAIDEVKEIGDVGDDGRITPRTTAESPTAIEVNKWKEKYEAATRRYIERFKTGDPDLDHGFKEMEVAEGADVDASGTKTYEEIMKEVY